MNSDFSEPESLEYLLLQIMVALVVRHPDGWERVQSVLDAVEEAGMDLDALKEAGLASTLMH
jgi:hypothetical protein